MEHGRLGSIGVWQSFMNASGTGILEDLGLLRVLLMIQTFCSVKPLDWGNGGWKLYV